MTKRADAIRVACAGLALSTVVLCPFAFGAVALSVWPPLATLWILLGVVALLAGSRSSTVPASERMTPMPRAMIALHALFALQLTPLPPSLLRTLSPGSFAAHLVPPPQVEAWAPLTASPTGTWQAWLFIAGLQGLAIALFSGSREDRSRWTRRLFLGMAAVGGILAVEGLVQSQSAHPYWLYGLFPVPGAGAHERGIFGPYYNRDHYSNLMAVAGSVTAGLLAMAAREGVFSSAQAFTRSRDFGRNLALSMALLVIVVANAASGSRGGLIALFAGIVVALGSALRQRPGLALASLGVLALALFGTGAPAAFVRMSSIDFEASRLLVWRDALRLGEFFPFFGCGIGAFAPAYWPYQRVVRFEYWPHLHNEYMQWVLEGGLAGTILAAYVLRVAWKRLPSVVRDQASRPALAGLAAALTHAFVDCTLRIPANAAWAALLFVCLSLVPRGPKN